MRISQLSERTGVPVATLKYYLREGLLARGRSTSATQADYDASHVARVQLIGALQSVGGLPLAKIRAILGIVDEPPNQVAQAMGAAVAALPPYVESVSDEQLPRARATLAAAGLSLDARYPAAVQLEAALEAVEAGGLPWDESMARRYVDGLRELAREEVEPARTMAPADAAVYAALGTAVYEPVILALRRLLHHGYATDAEGFSPPAAP